MGDERMGRKVFKFVLLSTIFVVSSSAYASGAIVFDATNAARFASIAAEARRQVQELRGVSNKMESLNTRLGGLVAVDGDRRTRLDAGAREWGTYIDGFGSIDAANLSLANMLGFRNFGSENRLLDLNRFLTDKLFPASDGNVSIAKMTEIKRFRNASVERASINGVALAGEKKHSLRGSQRKIAEIASEGVRSTTIHDDLVVTNKLLSLIANEMTQQRELMSQQLELISAVVAQGSPIVSKGGQ